MNDQKLHPLAEEVQSKLGNENRPFIMLVKLKVQAGLEASLKSAFETPLQETVKEEGNQHYQLIQKTDESSRFIVIEHWKSLQALNEHLHQPYLTQLLENIDPILDQPPEVDVFLECQPV